MAHSKPAIIFIVGCTASGKGSLGRALAERFGAEILSVDSMKVYKYMDIGTAKPTAEQRSRVPHHLIDVIDPSESFSAALFTEKSEQIIAEADARNTRLFALGGTALYLKALTEGIFEGPGADKDIRAKLSEQAESDSEGLYQRLAEVDPETASGLHRNDTRRIIRALEVYMITGRAISSFRHQFGTLREDYDMLFLGLRHERENLNRRINERVRRMVRLGLVDEVRQLYVRNPPLSPQAKDAVGYAEIISHFEGKWDIKTAIEKIKINTRRLGKHQRTWFRRMPHIRWFEVTPETGAEELAEEAAGVITSWLEGLAR